MRAKKRILTAATLSAFLGLAGAIQAQNTGGDKALETGKKPGKIHAHRGHKGGKRGHKGGKKGHKGGRKHKKGSPAIAPPAPR